MTFLELCQAYVREAGIDRSGTPRPVSVQNQVGELASAVDWVRQAYIEIQRSKSNWAFLRGYFTLDTVDGQQKYAASDCKDVSTGQDVDRFAAWWLDDIENPPKCYLKSTGRGGEYWMTYIERRYFNQLYAIGNNAIAKSMPAHIAIDFDRKLMLGLTPNDVYVVSGEYQKSAQVLTEDDDIPEMPEDFHYLIVYEALRKYGGSDMAPEVLMRVETEGAALRSSLVSDQLPNPGDYAFSGRPLA